MFRHSCITRKAAGGGGKSRTAARHLTRRRSTCAAALTVMVTGAGLALMAAPAHADNQSTSNAALVSSVQANEAPEAVAAEDLRLTKIQRDPYSLAGAARDTLVLAPRSSAYTLADLQLMAPNKLAKQNDGSYLLSEHIAVMPGATLRLSEPGGLTLRLASGPGGFVSIVSLGGNLELIGEKGAPVKLSSWDVDADAPDEETGDGRAYLRAIDGRFTGDYVAASNLGFWSGRTGGFALTGTALPKPATPKPIGWDGGDVLKQFFLDEGSQESAGPLPPAQRGPNLESTVPAPSHVSNSITHTSITGNAFGLFISGTDGISIRNSMVRDSLISGVVLHRYVTNGVLSRISSNNNAGHGFLLDRATSGITVDQATANNNASSGFTVSGTPEADGPSLAGASTIGYGDNMISNSTAKANGKYGVHILGGGPVGVQNNRVTDTDMGIMVTGPAQRISIVGNEIVNVRRHGIALVDGVSRSTVTDNTVDGSSTGVYLRGSVGQVNGNTVQRAETHGVALVGHVAGSDVVGNVLAGSGASALDSSRSSGAGAVAFGGGNDVHRWDQESGFYFWFQKLFHPMTIIWGMVALLLIVSAIRSRKNGLIVHPYAHQMAHQSHLPIPVPQVIDAKPVRSALGRSTS